LKRYIILGLVLVMLLAMGAPVLAEGLSWGAGMGSCYYGNNSSSVKMTYYGDVLESANYVGLSVGGGGLFTWGRTRQNGVDFDLFLIASTSADLNKLEAEGYDISGMYGLKFSVGYRRRL
jgi:hypothetical protein